MKHHHIIWKLAGRNGLFDYYCSGELLGRSRTPFTDGARSLLASGVAGPFDKLTGGATAEEETLSCTVRTAANLTVNENRSAGPKFYKWQPYPVRPPGATYSVQKDFADSLGVGYAAIRQRVADGGPGWERKA